MWTRAIIPLSALSLIFVGAWCIYRPLGPLVVGLLLWADMTLLGVMSARTNRRVGK